MKIEEQRLTREQLFALRDYHSKAADDALGRIILAVLAGAGSGLVFLANSPIPTGGPGIRALGLASGAALLIGIVFGFGALLSSRNLHLVEGLGYSLKIQKAEFATDLAPHIAEHDAEEIRLHHEQNLQRFGTFRDRSEDQAQRFVKLSTAATFLGVAILAGVYFYAPPRAATLDQTKMTGPTVETASKVPDK